MVETTNQIGSRHDLLVIVILINYPIENHYL